MRLPNYYYFFGGIFNLVLAAVCLNIGWLVAALIAFVMAGAYFLAHLYDQGIK